MGIYAGNSMGVRNTGSSIWHRELVLDDADSPTFKTTGNHYVVAFARQAVASPYDPPEASPSPPRAWIAANARNQNVTTMLLFATGAGEDSTRCRVTASPQFDLEGCDLPICLCRRPLCIDSGWLAPPCLRKAGLPELIAASRGSVLQRSRWAFPFNSACLHLCRLPSLGRRVPGPVIEVKRPAKKAECNIAARRSLDD
jgi:hypothetical protein